jgi:hypothetical protein
VDIVKTAANLTGEAITYNQGYRAIKTKIVVAIQNEEELFQYIIPYLSHFQQSNLDASVFYKLVEDKLESIFICPGFINVSLCYIRPVMSLDATHLKPGS